MKPLHALSCISLSLTCTVLSGCSMFNRTLEPGARFFVAPESIGPIDGEKFESIMVQRFRTVPPSDNTNFCYVREDGSWQMDQTNGWFTDPADMYCDVFAAALEQSALAMEQIAVKVNSGVTHTEEASRVARHNAGIAEDGGYERRRQA